MLTPLDNEVIFKKAFTDPFVLRRFVKDVVGVDFDPGPIETEKKFSPKSGNIDFAYDIFAESKDHRVVVEMQRVEYDYHFDRFLHYHFGAVIELQKAASDYKIDKKVFTIVLLTAPYTIKDGSGSPVKDDILVSSADPVNLEGRKVQIFGHELYFLNPNHIGERTPPACRDWLSLIYESIHNPNNYSVNMANEAVRKAVGIIDFDGLSGEEVHAMKIAAGRKAVEAILRHTIEEKDKAIEDQRHAIEEKDKALAEKDRALAEQRKALEHAAALLSDKSGMPLADARRALGLQTH